jgi:DNA-binding HxlR family transcriptional regulator
MGKIPNDSCAIARSLGLLGERWTFLILREAVAGSSRFSEFRSGLGVAPDVLTARLNTLVEYGVVEKVPYREPGERARFSYVLTDAGRELLVVLLGLQQWGDKHLPWPDGPSILRQVEGTERPVHVGFIDDDGNEVAESSVALIPTAPPPAGSSAAPSTMQPASQAQRPDVNDPRQASRPAPCNPDQAAAPNELTGVRARITDELVSIGFMIDRRTASRHLNRLGLRKRRFINPGGEDNPARTHGAHGCEEGRPDP